MLKNTHKGSNVVNLHNALTRSKEAEGILLSMVRLSRDRGRSDFDYAEQVMNLEIKSLLWAKNHRLI